MRIRNILLYKAFKRNLLGYLTLCGLLCLSSTIPAVTAAQPSHAMDSYPREEDQKQEEPPAAVPFPPGQLLIPANGQCLYTTIIMGYLLPVRQDKDKLTARIGQLFGCPLAYYLNKLHQTLQNPTHYPTYLHSDAFSLLVTAFMARMQIKKGTWGGPQEIQTIANKLNVNIRAYYPDPSNPTNLVRSDLTKPVQAAAAITLYIVRDKVHPAEVLTHTEKVSAEDNPYYQHYRLKYTLPFSIQERSLTKQQPSILDQRELPKKNAIQSYLEKWFEAAKNGDRQLLSQLYHHYTINVNTRNTKGNTALLYGAYNGHLDCVMFLVDQGADIHAQNEHNYTAMLLSAQKGHVACVKYLYGQGANIETSAKDGNTALLWSAYNGHLVCVKFLVAQGAGIHATNEHGETALLLSAYSGHLACIKFLYQQGADINTSDNEGDTALLLSAQEGHLACIKYLLQQGADINTRDKDGYTALQFSVQEGHLDCLQFLVSRGANIHEKNKNGLTMLLYSAASGQLDCLKWLLQQGAGIHDRNKNGDTALILSAYKGHLGCVQYLVQQGADVILKGQQSKTALEWARERDQKDVVNYLSTIARKKQPDKDVLQKWFKMAETGNIKCLAKLHDHYHITMNTRSTQGKTALISSAYSGYLACVKFLVQQGADINAKDKYECTALMLTAQQGYVNCVKYLLQRGADINAKNGTGYTALLLSACTGQLDCIKWLLQQGADINTRAKHGDTALQCSAYKGHLACVKFLVGQGADVTLRGQQNKTALQFAKTEKKHDVAHYLSHLPDHKDHIMDID